MTTYNYIPAFLSRLLTRKFFLAVIFALLSFSNAKAQSLDFSLVTVVSNDTLFIEYYVEDQGLVINAPDGQGFGPSELPIYFDDTTLFESTNATISFRGVWDAANTPVFYDAMTIGFVNDSVLNLLINPIYGNPLDPSQPAGAFITPSPGTPQHIATVAIPIKACGDIDVNWIPTGLANSGARVLWDGTDVSNAPSTTYLATTNPVALSVNTLHVTTLNDEGCGSLREAINFANSHLGPDTITFDPALTGGTIMVGNTSGLMLPDILDDSTFINAQTDPNNCLPDITIDGTAAPAGAHGLLINGADYTIIFELAIINFEDDGLRMQNGAFNNDIINCHIGVDRTGAALAPNLGYGVFITQDSWYNRVAGVNQGNCVVKSIVSGNQLGGVFIDAGCDSNSVFNTIVGSGINQTEFFGNGSHGILVRSNGNAIGLAAADGHNLISDNDGHGVYIDGSFGGGIRNSIQHNRIGTNGFAIGAIPNAEDGIRLMDGAKNNIIGGDISTTARNYIGGNSGNGISIRGADSNLVGGNIIGVNITSTADIPNTNGIYINNADVNFIGVGLPNFGNVISGNDVNGIFVENNSYATSILGNTIGLNESINGDRGNGAHGIRIDNSTLNRIGGASDDSLNVISGNGGSGIELNGTDTTIISGNRIGTDFFAVATFGNDVDGISVNNTSVVTIIGTGGNAASGNFIGGNGQAGISNIDSDETFILGNVIGIDATGSVAMPNGDEGIFVNASEFISIGDTATNSNNIISGNGAEGIILNSVDDAYIIGNIIGKDGLASDAIPNGSHGILVEGGSQNDSIILNQIAFNSGQGILFDGNLTNTNIALLNSIHSNTSLGIAIRNGAQNNVPIPVISGITLVGSDTILSGTSEPGALIQVYCDSLHEGQVFYDTTLANAAGDWSKVINGIGVNTLTGLDSITVLQNDINGNTSQFSAPIFKTLNCTVMVDLGNDTALCANSYQINATYNAGATFTWTDSVGNLVSSGVDDSILVVSSSHKYFVTVDDAGCTAEDSVLVTLNPNLTKPNAIFASSTGTSVTFLFDSIPGALSYTVMVDTCSGNKTTCAAHPLSGTTILPTSSPESFTVTPMGLLDSAIFWVRANGPCDSIYSDTVSAIADTCNAAFTGLDSSLCSSSLLQKIFPTFSGGTFTASPIPTAVRFAPSPSNFWYFDPSEAGPGTHTVYYTGCSGTVVDSFTTVIQPAPCVSTIADDSTAFIISEPQGIYTDCDGQIFFSNAQDNNIAMLDTFGFAQVVAGDSLQFGFLDEAVSNALMRTPVGITMAPNRNIYFVDGDNHSIRMIRYNTMISAYDSVITISGGNGQQFTNTIPVLPDYVDGPGLTARFYLPFGITIKPPSFDTLYVSELGPSPGLEGRIRGIELVTGNYNTWTEAGMGLQFTDQTRHKDDAILATPRHLVATETELIFAIDNEYGGQGNQVAQLNFLTDSIEVLAGNFAINGDVDGVSADSRFTEPIGVSVTCGGDIFVADVTTSKIRVIDTDTLAPDDTYTSTVVQCANPPFCFPPAATDLSGPSALSVFVQGYVDIADTRNSDIKRFQIEDYSTRPFSDLDTVYCTADLVDTIFDPPCGVNYAGNGISVVGDVVTFNPSAAGPGTHTLTYTFSQGFCTETITYDVTVYTNPTIDLGQDTVLCLSSLGIDSLTIDSNFATIQWTVNSVSALADTNYWRITDVDGEYIVNAIDTNGCAATDTVNLFLGTSVEVEITSNMTDSICYGDTATLTANNIGTGPGFLYYSWNTSDTTSSIDAYFSGDYYVEVTDSLGCTADTTFRNIVRNAPAVCINVDPTLTGASGARYGEWTVSTIAGDTNGVAATSMGTAGQTNGNGLAASFNTPWDILYHDGYLYVTESANGGLVRRIRLSDTLVETFAGSTTGTIADSVPRLSAGFNDIKGIGIDPDSNFYIVQSDAIHYIDLGKDSVYRITGGASSFTDGHISVAEFNSPRDIDVDGFGNVFIADYNNHLVRGLYIDDTVRTLAGVPFSAVILNGPPGVSRVSGPFGVALDPEGNIKVGSEIGNAVTNIDLDLNHTTDVVGFGSLPYFTKVHTSAATMQGTWNIVSDKTGKLFITEGTNSYISTIDAFDSVQVIAGDFSTGVPGPSSGDGLGGTAGFRFPAGITLEPETGDLYVADRSNHLIRKMTQNKTITICEMDSIDIDGSCPNAASYMWSGPVAFVDPTNPVQRINTPGTYILTISDGSGCSNSDSIIIEHYAPTVLNIDSAITLTPGPDSIQICTTDSVLLYGNPMSSSYTYSWEDYSGTVLSTDSAYYATEGEYILNIIDGNGCPAVDTMVVYEFEDSISIPSDTTICFGDCIDLDAGSGFTSYLWSDSSTTQMINVCGGAIFDVEVTTANGCTLYDTIDVQVDIQPEVSISPSNRKFVDVYAGDGTQALANSTDPLMASFDEPNDVAISRTGIVYVADRSNNAIRRIDVNGSVTTLVQDPALDPTGITVNKDGDIFVASFNPSVIYKVTPAGVMTVYAGDAVGVPAAGAVDGDVLSARFFHPFSISVDESNRIYVADAGNHLVRIIDPKTKMVSSIGVDGVAANVNGDYSVADFIHPGAIEVDINGDVFVAGNLAAAAGEIRRINPRAEQVSTFNLSGNTYNYPLINQGLASDEYGNVFAVPLLAEITKTNRTDSSMTSVYGNAVPTTAIDFDNQASVHQPLGMDYDYNTGRLYIADQLAHRVRVVYDSAVVTICPGDSVELTASVANAGTGTFLWSTGETGSSIYASSGGVYTVTYLDPTNTNCAPTDSVTVIQLPRSTFSSVTPDTTICAASTVDLIASATIPGDSIIWMDAMGTVLSWGFDADTITVDSSMAGTYTARVNGNGCYSDTTVTVTVNDLQAIAGNVIGADTIGICFGDTAVLSARLSNGGLQYTNGLPYTYLWTGTGGSLVGLATLDTVVGTIGSVIPGSYETYYANITDSLGCTQVDSVVILWNDSLYVDAGPDTAICAGNTITLTATPMGGSPSYTVNWTDTSGVATGLGNSITVTPTDTIAYFAQVTDSVGCVAFDTLVVYPVIPMVDAGINDTICPGTTSLLTATPINGVGPYGFAWTPLASLDDSTLQTPTASPLVTTEYIVIMTDSALNCTASDTVYVVLSDLQAIAGTIDGIDPGDTINVCFGDSATLDASLTNGGLPFAAGYSYNWTADPSFTGPTIINSNREMAQATGGTPGMFNTFYVAVRDSAGCTDTDSVIVYWNNMITAVGIPDTVYTCGANADSIFATATGGNGRFSYQWGILTGGAAVTDLNSDSTTVIATDTSSLLLTATDGLGCQNFDTVAVLSVDFQIAASAQFDTICPAINNLLDVVPVSGGVGPYGYAWSPSATLDDTTLQQPTSNITTTTSYAVSVIDSTTGCTATDNITIVVLDLTAIAGNVPGIIGDTLIGCYGDTLDVSGTSSFGGTPFSAIPYLFSWSQTGAMINGSVSDTIVRLYGGASNSVSVVNLEITDSLGCTSMDSAYVFWNPELSVTGITPALAFVCNSDTGSLSVTAMGGTGSYTYSWMAQTGNPTFLNPTGNPVDFLLPDTADIIGTVTDSLGCTASGVALARSVLFTDSITATSNPACPNVEDTITVYPIGGNGTFYNYTWNTGSTTDTTIIIPTSSTPITASVTVSDPITGCVISDSIEIMINDIAVDAGPDTAICNLASIMPNALVTGGTGGYMYSWSTPLDTANFAFTPNRDILSPTITPTAQGVLNYFILTATDNSGCWNRDTMTIYMNFPLVALPGAIGINTICESDSTIVGPGSGLSPVIGGTSPEFEYTWSSSPVTNVDGDTTATPMFVPTAPGSYTFTLNVVDTIGCSPPVPYTKDIDVVASPLVDLGIDTFFCAGSNVTVNNAEENPGATFEWRSDSLTGAIVGTPDSFYTTATSGTYFLIVTGGGIGCQESDSIVVDEELLPVITAGTPPSLVCNNQLFDLPATATGGSRGATYLWATSNGDQSLIIEEDSLMTQYDPDPLTDPNPINFTITYTTVCGTVSDNFSVNTVAGPQAGFDVSSTNVFPGDLVTFTDTTIGTITDYIWAFGGGTSPDSAFTVGPHDVDYNSPGLQTAVLIVEDNNGCFDTATVIIDVVSTKILYVPNVMSPSAIGAENQVAKVYGVNIANTNFEFNIYNRWGELIYETTDFTTANTIGWNGTHHMTNEPQDAGVYTYTLRGEFYDGETFEKTGTITVIR